MVRETLANLQQKQRTKAEFSMCSYPVPKEVGKVGNNSPDFVKVSSGETGSIYPWVQCIYRFDMPRNFTASPFPNEKAT